MRIARITLAVLMLGTAAVSIPAAAVIALCWAGFELALSTNRRAGSSE